MKNKVKLRQTICMVLTDIGTALSGEKFIFTTDLTEHGLSPFLDIHPANEFYFQSMCVFLRCLARYIPIIVSITTNGTAAIRIEVDQEQKPGFLTLYRPSTKKVATNIREHALQKECNGEKCPAVVHLRTETSINGSVNGHPVVSSFLHADTGHNGTNGHEKKCFDIGLKLPDQLSGVESFQVLLKKCGCIKLTHFSTTSSGKPNNGVLMEAISFSRPEQFQSMRSFLDVTGIPTRGRGTEQVVYVLISTTTNYYKQYYRPDLEKFFSP